MDSNLWLLQEVFLLLNLTKGWNQTRILSSTHPDRCSLNGFKCCILRQIKVSDAKDCFAKIEKKWLYVNLTDYILWKFHEAVWNFLIEARVSISDELFELFVIIGLPVLPHCVLRKSYVHRKLPKRSFLGGKTGSELTWNVLSFL